MKKRLAQQEDPSTSSSPSKIRKTKKAGGSENVSHKFVDASQVVQILKDAASSEKMPRKQNAVAVCLKLSRSALRFLNVEAIDVIRREQRRKNKVDKADGESLDTQINEIRNRADKAPYQFIDKENLIEVLLTSIDVIKQRKKRDDDHDHDDHISPAKTIVLEFEPFWTDVQRFLKNKPVDHHQSRLLITSLKGLFVSIANNADTLRKIVDLLVPICLHSDLHNMAGLHASLLDFVAHLASSSHSKEHLPLKKRLLKRVLNGFLTVLSKCKTSSDLEGVRQTLPTVTQTISAIQQVDAELVYGEGLQAIKKITSVVCSAEHQSLAKSTSVGGGESADSVEVVSWKTLFSTFVWLSVIQAEPLEASHRFSLKKQGEAWATILIGLIRFAAEQPKKYPFILKCLSMILGLMQATRRFVPAGMLLLQVGYRLVSEQSVAIKVASSDPKTASKLVKMSQLRNSLRLREESYSFRVREEMFADYITLVGSYLAELAHHPAFPETSNLIGIHLKRISKLVKNSSLRDDLKLLIEAIAKTSRQVQTLRGQLLIQDLPQTLYIFEGEAHSSLEIPKFCSRRRVANFWDKARPTKAAW